MDHIASKIIVANTLVKTLRKGELGVSEKLHLGSWTQQILSIRHAPIHFLSAVDQMGTDTVVLVDLAIIRA